MPNWNSTNAVITGEEKQVMAFGKLLQELESLPESLLPNDFGKLWCGNIVHKLGADWEKVYCRGWITDYNIVSPDRINLSVESAWGELAEVRKLVISKFPGIEIYHQSEEPGMCIFTTNDKDGRYFPEKWLLDWNDEARSLWIWEYFTELPAVIEFLKNNEILTKDIYPSYGAITAALDEILNQRPDDISYMFVEIKLVDD